MNSPKIPSILLFLFLCLFNTGCKQKWHYKTKVQSVAKAQPIQFFTLGRLKQDINACGWTLKLNGINYHYALVRISDRPVESVGDAASSGSYFIGSPTHELGVLGRWANSSDCNSPYYYQIPRGSYFVLEIYFKSVEEARAGTAKFTLSSTNRHKGKKLYFNRFDLVDISLPPNSKNIPLYGEYTIDKDIHITSVKPTMHLRGVSAELGYQKPNEPPQTIHAVVNYDLTAKAKGHLLAPPVLLPKGSKLWIRGVFDNSTTNPKNPDPTLQVRRGWRLDEEILRFSYQYTLDPQ